MRTTRLVAAALAAALTLAAACGDGDDEVTGGNAGEAAARTTTTTTEPTTTTGSTTTTTAPTTTTTEAGLPPGPEYVTTEGPSGAGCTPGDTTELPDGWWAGQITSVQDSSVAFDLVCFFSGAAATQAAEEDGTEATNDYYVRNNNARTFEIPFPDGTAPATCVGMNASPFACEVGDVLTLYRSTSATATSVLDGTSLSPFPLVWVSTSGGSGDSLYMQYTP